MFEKIKLNVQGHLTKERATIIGALLLVVVLTLWIAQSPQEKATEQVSTELVVPVGYLVIPLELTNANALAALISREAVIDLFQHKKAVPLAENLKVIKLAAGEGPLFGALVPRKLAGHLQDIFSGSGLRGAIRTRGAGAVTFHLAPPRPKTLLEEVPTNDALANDALAGDRI